MKNRIEYYNNHRGKYSPLLNHNGIVCGFWLIGRWYNATKNGTYYYGAYPSSYLDRMKLLFYYEMTIGRVLHLFSGTIKGGKEERFTAPRIYTMDLNPEPIPNVFPTIVGNAEEVDNYLTKDYFDIILADPPYDDNYKKYNTPKVNRKKTIHACSKIIKTGGFLIWLDTIMPQWRKKDGWIYKGSIGLCQSTNHRIRGITILQMGIVM